MVFSFRDYCIYREMAANRSIAHLLDLAHSDRLMVIISSYRNSEDQPPPLSMHDLEADIRRMKGFEVIPNPICATGTKSEGPNPVAELPFTGEMGVTKARGGYKEKDIAQSGDESFRDVCEDSLIVSHRRGPKHPSDEQVLEFFTNLARKYGQESFLFKSPNSEDCFYVYSDGRPPDNMGIMTSVGMLERYFTMLRKGHNAEERRVSAKPRPDSSF